MAQPRTDERGRHEGGPGVEDQGRDEGIVPGEAAASLHVGGEPVNDLPPDREPEELLCEAMLTATKPWAGSGAGTRPDPIANGAAPGGGTGQPHHQAKSADAAIIKGPIWALGQGGQAEQDPEATRRHQCARGPLTQDPEIRRTGSRGARAARVASVVASLDSATTIGVRS